MTEHALIFVALLLISGIVLIPIEKRINSKRLAWDLDKKEAKQ